MQRYLVFFSYIGTRFRGAQAQLPPNVTPRVLGFSRMGDFEDRTTVQGMFNLALKRFKPLNTPVLVLSSRTDTGVHALCSSGHFDMLHPRHEEGPSYQSDFLVNGLNRYFDKAKSEISVHRVLPVPDTFHSRYSAVGREYLYRLGVVLPPSWPPDGDGHTVKALTPIGERYRSFIVGGEFSMARLRACAALLSGEHDFRSLMGTRKGPETDVRTRRDLEIEVCPGSTAVPTPDIQFWNIHFRSQGFLFRQVRRTVGVLVACARGRMTPDDVRHLLEHPDKASWNSAAATAPPHGLYLSRVSYCLDHVGGLEQTTRLDRSERLDQLDHTGRPDQVDGQGQTNDQRLTIGSDGTAGRDRADGPGRSVGQVSEEVQQPETAAEGRQIVQVLTWEGGVRGESVIGTRTEGRTDVGLDTFEGGVERTQR